MSVAVTLHILAAVIWVGGMFFAYMALRPAAAELLDPPLRLNLWRLTLKRFFLFVWISVILILVTGYWMIFQIFGGMHNVGIYVHVMQTLGIVMILLFMHVFFAPYRRLRLTLQANDFQTAGKHLNVIRKLVAINLSLGLIVIIVATGGRYI